MKFSQLLSPLLALPVSYAALDSRSTSKPNIVFILSDDQDYRLGSLDFMSTVNAELVSKGVSFSNHHTTTSQCCPSRTSLLRGQAAHNTNITMVFAPGGNYEKFVLSGQVNDYLPHWLKKAGYNAEYLGKFLNGVNVLNWPTAPKGWDHIEYFMEPYQTTPNRVVMSSNGERPIAYLGYHQTDVIKAKALSRLDHLTEQEDPFFLFVSPTAPHVDDEEDVTVPCARHMDLYPNATAPRTPSYNPPDDVQQNKAGWIRDLSVISEPNRTFVDGEFRRRAQALTGIDEMVADIVAKLEEKGVMENTYIIYTSDNGYHLGQHRMPTGKATPFAEDTNLPFIVRGPGIPEGKTSKNAQAHLDLAPTILDIVGLDKAEWPPFLDGRSLLDQWENPDLVYEGAGQGNNNEVLNIEYWGANGFPVPGMSISSQNSTYKSLRIVGEDFGYLYSVWCYTNEVELYDTAVDPYELKNLALNPDDQTSQLMKRLNAMLLVKKSCATNTCQNPWTALLGGNSTLNGKITTLKQALDPQYDVLFDSFPQVNIAECLGYQDEVAEAPFWPAEAKSLGREYRKSTDGLGPTYKFPVMLGNEKAEGGPEHRHATLEEIMAKSRELTDEELDPLQDRYIMSSGRS
ncbi:arylsulfatase [Xylariomycetidae sp. FL0641]|nr:arylsulfatase [Xylariomycetidae sp. FL0641]